MTRNQRRAIEIACALCAGHLSESTMSDCDWNLLLLAAEINDCRARPLLVCQRVLERAMQGLGYFAGTHRRRGAECRPALRIPPAVVRKPRRPSAAAI
jgi:hypothetical protein